MWESKHLSVEAANALWLHALGTPNSTLTRSSHATAAQDPLRPRLHTAQGGGRALGEERRRRLSPARLSLFEVL